MREGVAGDEAYVVDGDVGVLGDGFPAGGVGVELVGLEGDGGGGFVAILEAVLVSVYPVLLEVHAGGLYLSFLWLKLAESL